MGTVCVKSKDEDIGVNLYDARRNTGPKSLEEL